MTIYLGSLQKAIASLDVALLRVEQSPGDDLMRDGVIQRFEYTFELSYKLMKRVLEDMAPIPSQIDAFSYQDLLREAKEHGLLDDVNIWMVYRHQRNITSDFYNADKAKAVFATAKDFIIDAKKLLQQLEKHVHD